MTTPAALRRDGAELLDAVRDALSRYCILPNRHSYTAVTLFCAYTHAAAVFDFAPRLVLTSPEKRSGKTRCLEIIHQLAHTPLSTANASTAALYRSLAEPRTVLLDEADTIFGTRLKAEQHDDLRGLLNAGFQRGTPVVRWDASKREVEQLHTFSPVVLAAIGRLPDTITDRAINIAIRRRKPAERVEPFRISRDAEPLRSLAYELCVWIEDNAAALKRARPDMPVVDRAADMWEPLVAVADLAAGPWPDSARGAAVALTEDAAHADADHSAAHELLANARDVLATTRGEFVATETLIAALVALPESRWADEGLTGRRLAMMLKGYGVPVGRNPSTSKRERGYRRADFTDAFERYLKPTENPAENRGLGTHASTSSISSSSNPGKYSSEQQLRIQRTVRPPPGGHARGNRMQRVRQGRLSNRHRPADRETEKVPTATVVASGRSLAALEAAQAATKYVIAASQRATA